MRKVRPWKTKDARGARRRTTSGVSFETFDSKCDLRFFADPVAAVGNDEMDDRTATAEVRRRFVPTEPKDPDPFFAPSETFSSWNRTLHFFTPSAAGAELGKTRPPDPQLPPTVFKRHGSGVPNSACARIALHRPHPFCACLHLGHPKIGRGPFQFWYPFVCPFPFDFVCPFGFGIPASVAADVFSTSFAVFGAALPGTRADARRARFAGKGAGTSSSSSSEASSPFSSSSSSIGGGASSSESSSSDQPPVSGTACVPPTYHGASSSSLSQISSVPLSSSASSSSSFSSEFVSGSSGAASRISESPCDCDGYWLSPKNFRGFFRRGALRLANGVVPVSCVALASFDSGSLTSSPSSSSLAPSSSCTSESPCDCDGNWLSPKNFRGTRSRPERRAWESAASRASFASHKRCMFACAAMDEFLRVGGPVAAADVDGRRGGGGTMLCDGASAAALATMSRTCCESIKKKSGDAGGSASSSSSSGGDSWVGSSFCLAVFTSFGGAARSPRRSPATRPHPPAHPSPRGGKVSAGTDSRWKNPDVAGSRGTRGLGTSSSGTGKSSSPSPSPWLVSSSSPTSGTVKSNGVKVWC
mmetsp:Transcript_4001/g.13366  ORF Transcript_4001/g.13366 Transcript_4001/m.13366 type:complete len:587 (-) Transcript_4001:206-1966(-)